MRRLAIPLTFALLLGAAPVSLAGGDAPAAAQAPADVITLKDGRRLEGEIVAEDDKFVSINAGGTTRAYARDTIASIEKAPRPKPATDAGTPQAGAPAAGPAREDAKRGKGDRKDAPLSESAKAWLDALIAKTADGDETVRRSVAAAISALGRQAVPAVRAAANAATEGPQKQFLTRLADEMESRGRDRKMRGDAPGPDGQTPGPDAAGRGPGKRMLEGLMTRLSAELELKDEQKPKVEAVMQAMMTQRFEIYRAAQTEGLTAEQVAERVTALRTDVLAKMKAVLDEPQYALFEDMAARLVEAPKVPQREKPGDKPGAPVAPPSNDPPK